MSLVSDALRKARQDASRGGGEGGRLPAPLQPPPRTRRPSVTIVVIVAAVAAILGAGVVWIVVHRPQGESIQASGATAGGSSPAETMARTPTVPVGSVAGVPGGASKRSRAGAVAALESSQARPVASTPRGGDAATPASASPTAAAGNVGAPAIVPKGGTLVAGESVVGEAQVPRAGNAGWKIGTGTAQKIPRIAPPEERTRTGKARETTGERKSSGKTREFVGEGTVDGVKLTLDYLVYRSKDPFAQINGAEVHVGWEVSGFKVVAIGVDSVRLQGKGGPVILRVH